MMIRKGSNVLRLIGTAGLLACLLVAQFHVVAHLYGAMWPDAANSGKRAPLSNPHRTAGLDCQGCATSTWSAPADSPHLEAPATILWLETSPRPQVSSQHHFDATASRAPPLA